MASKTNVEVTVVLTPKEYEALRREGALTGPGTVAAALRERGGMPDVPYGRNRPVVSETEYLEASDREVVTSPAETITALFNERN